MLTKQNLFSTARDSLLHSRIRTSMQLRPFAVLTSISLLLWAAQVSAIKPAAPVPSTLPDRVRSAQFIVTGKVQRVYCIGTTRTDAPEEIELSQENCLIERGGLNSIVVDVEVDELLCKRSSIQIPKNIRVSGGWLVPKFPEHVVVIVPNVRQLNFNFKQAELIFYLAQPAFYWEEMGNSRQTKTKRLTDAAAIFSTANIPGRFSPSPDSRKELEMVRSLLAPYFEMNKNILQRPVDEWKYRCLVD